ncbi:RNA-binding S4 domain-containing protein [Thalassotalea sp. M1531]|uniref:RNA-binding S4 domain-containing protein n=1 Tax=Thalassotalea algicola TaxID=2716224 RepID=A0A7Y0Q7M0_9GAMM|nr:RNA-binding S4 domain-containing protein [Thalassotalea algicola]NMP32538.1 RNA-binding S4 domain-containing protein [Thalassotalea algicola]
MTDVYLVEIDQQPIELYKLLKIADLVSGGGEAKIVISEGYVLLNNEVEFQKRKKVYDGDYIQFGDNIIEVKFVEKDYTEQPPVKSAPSPSKKKSTQNKKKNKPKPQTAKDTNKDKGKRRAISF